MPFFKNVFKPKDASRSGSKAEASSTPAPRPRWEEAWSRKDVAPEEIQELVHVCTQEMKSRAIDMPFILLPFRPTSDTSASRNFVRNFFKASYEGTRQFRGESLAQELRLTEPLTLCSIMKWCWSRLPGGVVTWDAYELFRIGESDSNLARHAFDTFVPLSVDSEARKRIIFDFFDLLSAVAARSKTNGMGGRKLSRMAGWWAFEFHDDGNGFDGGYRTWEKAADAASHLFFAYLRSLSPDPNTVGGISNLPRSLQSLLSQTEYPPQAPTLMNSHTTKVVMIVNSVSPTPFALLRRARNFEYRDDDAALQQFSAYDDTVKALTDECRRVLEAIASANQSVTSPGPTTPDPSWSRFEDFGFSGLLEDSTSTNGGASTATGTREFSGLRNGPRSGVTDFGRPTTPSWADFLSSGFADENNQSAPTTLLLPTQKLPPLGEPARVHSSQSHVRNGIEEDLEPGELASITAFDLDETFWWVWMTSLANEETPDRKAAFGRCTVIETRIPGGKWLIMEEQVKGAAVGPEEGAYIAEKKSMFSFTKRGRLGRRKSTGKKTAPSAKDSFGRTNSNTPSSTIGADQHARIQAAAAKLAQKDREQKAAEQFAQRRGRRDEASSIKTNSVLTLQPHLLSEAGPAMKWDKRFGEGAMDKDALRAHYLGDINAGKGSKNDLKSTANGRSSPLPPQASNRDLPALPMSQTNLSSSQSQVWHPPAANSSQDVTITPVPWPEDSPLPTPRLEAEDTPLSATETANRHPALKAPMPERKAITPVPSNVRASEEKVKQSEPKKLEKKKKEGGGGFRKLFGRKKTDPSAPVGNQPRPSEDESQLRALEAARSASRVSHHDQQPREPSVISLEQAEPVMSHSQHDQMLAEQLQPAMRQPGPPLSPDTLEQQEADKAFSRFDQGPMDDMPAFVPDDSDDEYHDAPPPVQRRPMGQNTMTSRPTTPPNQRGAYTRDDMSEDSVEAGRQVSPSQDRWAQIRRNAADRAARLSEEQTHRSRSQSQSQRTDEGETSGEETIESRVARIKARVAELTGNVDGAPARPNGAMR